MAETTRTEGAAYIQMEPLATQADVARLEAKIDRLLALLEPPNTSVLIDFLVDNKAIASAVLPNITAAALAARKASNP